MRSKKDRGKRLKKIEKNEVPGKITRWDLFKVFIASFFMQAVWNFRSLISIGFSICFIPIIGKLCDSPQAKREFFQRHLKFFNAHPYFASYALGVSIRLEEMRVLGQTENLEMIDRLKDLLISPLGAVGDRLFWATIKPAVLVLGALGIFIAPSVFTKILVLIFCFFLYNIPHFYYRYEGIIEGYNHPLNIHEFIRQERFEHLRKFFVSILLISLFVLVSAYSYYLLELGWKYLLIFLMSTIVTIAFNRFSNNFYLVMLGVFFAFLLAVLIIF
jgi:mannose/fructose/N-acetylgalactosamine-specific phosphotransferase system component IID